jgi:protein TIF31
MQGDLIYITFTSLEGDLYHITGHIKGFFVSRSTNQKFDPTPKNPQKLPTHSLLTLLQSLSPQFNAAFTSLHPSDPNSELLSDAPLANSLPAFPWLTHPPQPYPDYTRTQKSWLESLLRRTRQSPRLERRNPIHKKFILRRRSRTTYPRTSATESLADFTACATYAAILVRRGELLALDPIPENHHEGQNTTPTEDIAGSMWHYK